MQKVVLILGAKGMLGQELCRVFSGEHYRVIAWDRDDVDVTQFEILHQRIREVWPDVIINATAYNAVDLCEENDDEYRKAGKLNRDVPEALAKISTDLQSIFVHYSTDYVFDGQQPHTKNDLSSHCCGRDCDNCQHSDTNDTSEYFAYGEDDQPCPISRYGKTKCEGEQQVMRVASTYYIIRLSKLFGSPASSTHAKRSFFDVMLELGRKNDEVKVVDGEMSCFTYAPDLAMATKKIVESQKPFGIYHVTNAGACTWYDGVEELYRLAQISTKIIPVNPSEFSRPAQRPQSSVLKNTKIEPLRSWQDALAEYVSDIQKES